MIMKKFKVSFAINCFCYIKAESKSDVIKMAYADMQDEGATLNIEEVQE